MPVHKYLHSEEIDASSHEDTGVQAQRYNILKNVFTVSIAFMLNFTAFTVCSKYVHYLYTVYYHSSCFYRPRSEGDNALDSIRPSIRLSVCLHSHG